MAQAMEAVVRFLAEEAVPFLAGEAVSLVLGFLGGAAYYRCRLWKLQRQAPSAEVTTAHISLSQQDYDHLARAQRWPGWCVRRWPGWCARKEGKLDKHTEYFIIKR